MGTVTDDMKPVDVFNMRDEYKPYGLRNFRTNYRNLQAAIAQQKESAEEDELALANYIQQKQARPAKAMAYPRWNGSDAEALLGADITSGVHERLKPEDLRDTRPEYKLFPLKVFRDHVYDEVRKRKCRAYWLHKSDTK